MTTTIINEPQKIITILQNGQGPSLGGSSGLGESLVITTGQTIPTDKSVIYFTPPATITGPPSDFDGIKSDCEANGFLYDDDTDVCSANGSVTTYFVNNLDVTLIVTNEAEDKYKWIINESSVNNAYVSAFYALSLVRYFTVLPNTSILIQKVNNDWRLLERIDNTGGSPFTNSAQLRALLDDETGTGVAVFANSPTLTNPHMAAGITFTGATYTPSGSTQSIDLAASEIQINLTAGSGTLTATLVAPSALAHGHLYVKQHATTQRDLVFASATAIAWHGNEPDWNAAPVGTEWIIPWTFDGAKIRLQGEVSSTTDLSVTRTSETVTVASSTGTDAVIPTVTTSQAGVLSAGKFNDFNSATNAVTQYAMLVNSTNGWASPTLAMVGGGEGDWTDAMMDNWQLGYWSIAVDEASGNVGPTKLEVHAIDGAYFDHAGLQLGVKHSLSVSSEYIVSDPPKFRATLDLGSMALEDTAAYQPKDSDLTAIAALTTTTFGRSMLTESSETTLKTTLALNNVENVAASTTYLPLAGGTMTGALTNSRNSAVSSPTLLLTGTIFTGGTATTTKPHVLIEPSGTTSTTWSTAGTLLGGNAPSGFAGNFIDCKLNNAARFSVSSAGAVGLVSLVGVDSVTNDINITGGAGNLGFRIVGASGTTQYGPTALGLGSTFRIRWHSNTDGTGTGDVCLARNAAGILEINNVTMGVFRDLILRDLRVNGMTSLGGGVGIVAIANATTVPTSNPTGGGVYYVEGGAFKYRGSSGTVTTLAPA